MASEQAPVTVTFEPGQGDRRGGRRPRGIRPRSPAVLALYALIVTLLVGSTTAFVAFDKTVMLVVDGRTRHIHTFAGSVQGVLQAADVKVGPRDSLTPAFGTAIHRGSRVVVRHGRPLSLTVDGKPRTVWVTALTVGEAADQLGIDPGAHLSAPRSQPLPLSGFQLDVRLPKNVVILLDRVRLEAVTTAATVADLLTEAGITLGGHDQVSPARDTPPTDGMVVRVVKLLSEPIVKTVPIEPPVQEKKTDKLLSGERKVVDPGQPGIKQIVYAYVMQNGKKTRTIIAQTIKRAPKPKIIEVGTKIPSAGGDVARLNWAALAQCESGGNPKAYNPAGYYGLYQFTVSTWQSVGGSGTPTDASGAEQTYRAQLLYQRVGGRWQSQWPVCGRHLFD